RSAVGCLSWDGCWLWPGALVASGGTPVGSDWGAGCLGWDACGLRLGRWLPRVGRRWGPTGALVGSGGPPVAAEWGAGAVGWDACGLRLGRWLSRARRRWLRTGALGTSDKTTAGAETKVLGGLGQEAAVSGREPVVAVAREPRPGRPGGQPASSRVRAVATRSSQPRHPDAAPAGSAHGSLDRTNRTPGRASHRSSTRTSSGLAPR